MCELLQKPETIPQLHRSWADSKQKSISALDGQAAQLLQRKQRLERQDQRLLDAYQAEIINLLELQSRRQKILDQLQEIELEIRQMNSTRQEAVHWQEIIENVNTFHSLLGQNLEKLSFEEKQSVARCLIEKVIVTGSDVDIHFILPFESAPQVCHTLHNARPEGPPGDFYWLRLADLYLKARGIIGHHLLWR